MIPYTVSVSTDQKIIILVFLTREKEYGKKMESNEFFNSLSCLYAASEDIGWLYSSVQDCLRTI